MRFSYILLAICLLILIFPVNASTAKLSWFNNTGSNATTAVDTNIDGSLFFVGFANGTIVAYNTTINATDNTAEANIIWRNQTNATSLSQNRIKKIVSDDNGNIVWISEKNQSGYISYTGAVISRTTNSSNISDVALLPDGLKYATTELRSGVTPSRVRIFNLDGTIYAQNVSFGTNANWTKVGYDTSNLWLITANESSNRVYFWNITPWTGWEQFNIYHTASKNASQQFIDSFPYREGISITDPASGEAMLTFINTPSVTYITQINNTHFYYNVANTGQYFYWTNGTLLNTSNVLFNQSNMLNASSIGSDGNYHVTLRRGITNFVAYFGNTSYSYTSGKYWVPNNTYYMENVTSDGGFIVPAAVNFINVTLVGGGGGGQTGGGTGGTGGSAGTFAITRNYAVTPLTSYLVVIGPGGGSSAAGGTTSFNTVLTAAGGAGGTGLLYTNGSNGIQNISNSYPSGVNGATGQWDTCCDGCYGYSLGKYGGAGYGAGGGGGGAFGGGCLITWGYGGAGANGIVQIGYHSRDVYSSSTTNTGHENRLAGVYALNQSSIRDYVGPVVGISVPFVGGLASISTDTYGGNNGVLYQQYISASGFQYVTCSSVYTGTPFDVKASNSLSTIEARYVNGIIYDSNSIPKAFTASGGILRSVDISMTGGQLAAFGGDDGKVYMLSREGSSGWLAYFTGSGTSPVTGVAVTWNGEAVVVTRQDGLVEYYITNTTIPPTPTISYVDAQLRVYKDGASYANQPVTVLSSTSVPYSWTPIATSYTDGGGRMVFTTTVGTYYKFIVNMVPGTGVGEGEKIWQSNPTSTIVQIFILSPSTPYEWNAYYTTSSNNVTVVYSDTITPTSVVVTIKDLKTNLDVLTRTYLATPSFTLEYHDQLGNGSYQVVININRLGTSLRDQRIVTSPNSYGSILPNDQYITWAISTFVLMLIAGMFSYSNSKRGALAVVILAGLFMWLKLLPMTMVTVASLAAIFAVMSLFASRVQ